MNENPKISVIVPVYKVEPYLHQCIESIVTQTYKNLEIILVNDGSPDSCGAICDEYAEKDSRIKVIHKPNGGLSDARNAGIDIASGEYLTFIDSDDWVEPDMVELLYNNLDKHDADISCCGYFTAYVNLSENFYNYTGETLILNSEQAIESILSGKNMSISAWNKLYKKYIFDDIRYPLEKFCEDSFIIIEVLEKVNKVVIENISKYYYRQRIASVMNNIGRIGDEIESWEHNFLLVEKNYASMYNIAKSRLFSAHLFILSQLIFASNYKKILEYKKILSTIRENYRFIIKSNYMRRNEKIKAAAIKISMNLFKLLQSINNRNKKNKILFK